MCEDQQNRRQKQGGREAFYLARQSMKTSGSGPGRGSEKSTPWMSLTCSRYQTSKGSCELAYASKTRGTFLVRRRNLHQSAWEVVLSVSCHRPRWESG